MVILQLVKNSLARRKNKALVSMIGLAFSISLLLLLVYVKNSLHHTLNRAISQSDLIVGAPSQPVHLALFGLFRIGNTPPAISQGIYETLREHPEIASAIPLSIMESHRGFQVTGTTNDLFAHFDPLKPLAFAEGNGFTAPYSVVLGAEAALKTGYKTGEQMTIAQGNEPTIADEYSQPLTISGILAATGTVLDNAILVNLKDLEQMRSRHTSGALQAESINLVLLRLHNRQALLPMEKQIKTLVSQPVEVVIPNQELRFIQRAGNQFTNLMIAIVVMTAAMAMVSVFFSVSGSLAERRYEIDTLRMLGARSYHVIVVGLLEPVLIILTATVVGFLAFKGVISGLEAFLPGEWRAWIAGHPATLGEVKLLLFILLAGSFLAAIPAWKTYGQCTRIK
ncbi:ABC transporter permease [Endozoicomonas sp. Mp262]|uniref:ABC transporter permease n=1 Tax=Endozoicomonas sp. Mp262 TaxID=2919499 RepID=UPI0021D7D51D